MEDITKTGPKGLKGLPGLNKKEQMDELIRKTKQSLSTSTPESVLSGYQASPIENVGIDLMNKGYGTSKYDKDAVTESQIADLDEFRSNEQSWFAQVGSGLAKGALLVGTTFLDGTVGLLVGGVEASRRKDWSGLWDNEFSRAMQSFNDWAEEALPNYYSREELESPWYTNLLSGNFIGDKFIKNLGFTIGAFYSGGLEVGAIKGLGRLVMKGALSLDRSISTVKKIAKTTDHVASVLGAFGSAVNEGRIEALNNSRDWYKVQKQTIDSDYNEKRALYTTLGDYDAVAKLDKDYQDTMVELEKDRKMMGNADLAMNIPILMASNLYQFGKLYANGFRTGRRANKIVGNITEGYEKGTTRAAGWRKAIGNALSEGTEEITQKMASTASGDYYQDSLSNFYLSRTDPDAEQKTLDWINSISQGISETVNEGSSWEEFFIGALTGAMGMPSFRSAKGADGKWQSPITLQGGIIGELRENKEQMEREQRIVDYMNKRVKDPKFREYYKGLIRHGFYQDIMDAAAQEGKEFEFKNAEFAQFLSDVNMFDNAGKLDDLKTIIDSALDTSDENLESIARNTQSVITREEQIDKLNDDIAELEEIRNTLLSENDTENADKVQSEIDKKKQDILNAKDKTVSAFVDENGNLTGNLKEKMKNDITNTHKEMSTVMEDYLKTKLDILDSVGESLSDDQLSEMIYLKMQLENWQQRGTEMSGYVKNILKQLLGPVRGLTGSADTETAENYKKFQDSLNNIISMSDEDMMRVLTNTSNEGFVDNIMLNLALYGSNIINGLDKTRALDILEDLKRIGTASELFNKKFEEYIKNPSKQAQRQSEDMQNRQQKKTVTDNIAAVDNIRNKSVSDIIQSLDADETDLNDLESALNDMDDVDDEKEKLNNVRGVLDAHSEAVSILGNQVEEGLISEQERDDVMAMLGRSRSISENEDEFFDLEGEAFNDLNVLQDNPEEIKALEDAGLSPQELREKARQIKQERLDRAKAVANQLAEEHKQKKETTERLPEGTVIDESETDQTGHDSVDRNEPINAPKPQNTVLTNIQIAEQLLEKNGIPKDKDTLLNDIHTVLRNTDYMHKNGFSEKDLKEALVKSPAWGNISAYTDLRKDVENIINDKIKGNKPKVEEKKEDKEEEYIETPIISSDNIDRQIDDSDNYTVGDERVSKNSEGKYEYWKPSTTEFPIHRRRGDDSPYYAQSNSPERARYEETFKFLKSRGVFARRNHGDTVKGNAVYFGLSKELNGKAGVPVILMLNGKGEIIGDLPVPSDANFNDYIGLPEFYAEVTDKLNKGELKDSGNDIIRIEGYSSSVSQNLGGKPQYTVKGDRNTLNDINVVTQSDNSTKPVSFKIGVALANVTESGYSGHTVTAEPGRTKKSGRSTLDRSILPPLNAVPGQPFLLMPTNNRAFSYVTVPVTMPMFNINDPKIAESQLGKLIIEKIKELETIGSNQDKLIAWSDSFKELLAYKEVFVDIKDNNGVKELTFRVKRTGDPKWTTIYHGEQSKVTDAALQNLSNGNSMFQVSRKYINTTYKGKDYNKMIGELATTNLPIGATHTVNDWFAINPIVKGKQQKAGDVKSTKNNPTATEGSDVRITFGGKTYRFTSSDKLYLENPNGNDPEVLDPKFNVLKAYGIGLRLGLPMDKPYMTKWGMYDPKTNKFVNEAEVPVAVPQIDGEVAKQLKSSSGRVKPTESDHSYTVDGQRVDVTVTQLTHPIDPEEEKNGLLGYLEISSRIGSEIGKILRNYFEGKVYNSPMFTEDQNKLVRKHARRLKDSLDTVFGKGWKAITDESMLRVSGIVQTKQGLKTVAGTMDMLIQDSKGIFHIIDFKTRRSQGARSIDGDIKNDYDNQVSLHAALLQTNNPLISGKVGASYLAVFNPFYDDPRGSRSNEKGNVYYTEENGVIYATNITDSTKRVRMIDMPSFKAGTFYQLQPVTWNNGISALVKGKIKATNPTSNSATGSNTQSQPSTQTQTQGQSQHVQKADEKTKSTIEKLKSHGFNIGDIIDDGDGNIYKIDGIRGEVVFISLMKGSEDIKTTGYNSVIKYFKKVDNQNNQTLEFNVGDEISDNDGNKFIIDEFKNNKVYLHLKNDIKKLPLRMPISDLKHYKKVINQTQGQPQSGTQNQQRATEVKLPSGTQVNLGIPVQMGLASYYFKADKKVSDDEVRFRAVKTSDKTIQFIPSTTAATLMSTDGIRNSIELYTDIESNRSVDSNTIVRIVSLGEAQLSNGRYEITKRPVVIISNRQSYIDETQNRLNNKDSNKSEDYSEETVLAFKLPEGVRKPTIDDIESWEPVGIESLGAGDNRSHARRVIENKEELDNLDWYGYNLITRSLYRQGKLSNQSSTEATGSSVAEDTVGGSYIALSYLLGGSNGVINVGYFLHGISAAFPVISDKLEDIRKKAGSELLGKKPNEINNHPEIIKEIRNAVKNAYGDKGIEILNKLLSSPSGLIYSEGQKLEVEINDLKPLTKENKTKDNKNKPELPATTEADKTPSGNREDHMNILRQKEVLPKNNKARLKAIDKVSDENLARLAMKDKGWLKRKFKDFDAMVTPKMTNEEVNAIVDKLLDSKILNRKAIDEIEKHRNWSMQKEVMRIRKMLPQLNRDQRLRFVKGLIKIMDSPDSEFAWGQFQDGIITLSSEAARGTTYHEAFHFVTQSLLSEDELNSLYKEARRTYGIKDELEVEERMAEDFRRFMQGYEDRNFISNIFRTLKHIIKNLFGKSTMMDNLFQDIRRGRLASRKVNEETNTEGSDILYRQAERTIERNARQMRIEAQRFLDNFAITMKDVDEFGGQEVLFDALERVINIRNANDISEGTGYAVAFMMQHDDRIENLIKVRHRKEFNDIVNPILDRMKKAGKEYKGKKISLVPNEIKNRWLREIGNDISYELKKLYNIEPIEKNGFLSGLWDIIMNFFKKFTPENRNKLYAIQYTTKYIADSIKLNDMSMIVNGYIKPGTDRQAIKVDIEEALRKYDFEREIIETMYDEGIALAGSASIAIDGTLYRPEDNPLHDLDFNAVGYNKANMDDMMKRLYKYHHPTQHISSEFGKETVSYLVMDRPYYTEVFYDEKGNKGERIYDKKTKELLGYTLNSDLILKEGVKGKELDFFIGGNNRPYPNKVVNLNGRPYLISDYRAAFNAKVTWAREKDMWDYNRFIPNNHRAIIDEIDIERQKKLIRNAKIIWGHPAIGKTTYLEQNDDILEWDAEVNPKRNAFIRDQIDPEHKMDIESEEYKRLRKAYMGSEWKTHPEYIKFLTDEWENLKQRAYREGKRLFASPAPLLEIGKDDFDLFVNLPENVFLQRNMQRGGDLRGTLGWKKVINERLVDVDQSKIVTTDLYFSEFMKQNYGTGREQSRVIQQYHRQKLDYGNLDSEQRQYLIDKGISREEYEMMTPQEREVLFRCM